MIRVAVLGAGRMGRAVAHALGRCESAQLQSLVSRGRPDGLGQTPWCSGLDQLAPAPDLLIDFSLPAGTLAAAAWCRANRIPLLSGTTGLGEAEHAALRRAAARIPVLWASNLSRGLNLLLRQVAATASALPPGTPVEIIDVHHVHKRDAPSGTALTLAQAIAAAWDIELDQCLGTGQPVGNPGPGNIHLASIREGEVIGDHRVTFYHGDECIELAHTAASRDIFAVGAVEAGLWLAAQPAGLYSALDWLDG